MQKLFITICCSLFLLIVANCKNGNLIFEEVEELEVLTIDDTEYVDNRFFFIDSYYMEYYESGFSSDIQIWNSESLHDILKIEVYKSSSFTDYQSRNVLASINPDSFINMNNFQLSNIEEIPGELAKQTMKPMKADEDYLFDPKKGIIFLKTQLRKTEILAVSYQTVETKVGTFSEDLNDTLKWNIARLIKDKISYADYKHIWHLVLRNAYIIPDSILTNPYFNLKIGFGPNGIFEYSQTEDPQYSYTYLLGLDRINSSGDFIEGGDGQFDLNQNKR